MKGRSPLVILVSDPSLGGPRPSALRRRATLLAAVRQGDGASHALAPEGPRLVVPKPTLSAAEAWRSRVDAAQAEARAALRVPFSPPVTWDPS